MPVPPHLGEGVNLHLSLLELPLETEFEREKEKKRVTVSSGLELGDCGLCKGPRPDLWGLLITQPLGPDWLLCR